MDPGTAELQRIDFRYTRLPYFDADWPQVGGRVEFERLANGMWIVEKWHIRMPAAGVRRRTAAGHQAQALTRLIEVGGRVQNVRTVSGELIAEAVAATIFGSAFDSVANRPFAGAGVEILGTAYRATTGSDGAYRLTGLPGGVYAVQLRHINIDVLGLEIEPIEVGVQAGQAVRVMLGIPSSPHVLQRVCPAAVRAGDRAKLVYGVVRGAGGAVAVPNAAVKLVLGDQDRQVTANDRGVYRVCLESPSNFARLSAIAPGQPSATASVDVELRGRVVARADVEIGQVTSLPSTRASHGSVWSNAIIGTVIDEETRDPIVTAVVSLTDQAGEVVASTLTDDRGLFRIRHPGRGENYVLNVEHTAFRGAERAIVFPTTREIRVEVMLSVRAVELDPIVVTARRRGYLADAGFYDRMRQSRGLFIEEREIEQRRASKLTDLFRGRAGVEVVRAGLNEDVRITTSGRLGGGDCQPAVWLDGAPVRAGGAPKVTHTTAGAVQIDPYLSDIVSPNIVSAIEIYRRASEVPAQYGGPSSACGVIVIWTRH